MSSVSLEKTRKTFKAWHRKKKGVRSRVPENLKEQAVDLFREYRLKDVSRELKISPSAITRWKRELRKQVSKKIQQESGLNFIELPVGPAGVNREKDIRNSPTMEITRPDGLCIKISGKSNLNEFQMLWKEFMRGTRQ